MMAEMLLLQNPLGIAPKLSHARALRSPSGYAWIDYGRLYRVLAKECHQYTHCT